MRRWVSICAAACLCACGGAGAEVRGETGDETSLREAGSVRTEPDAPDVARERLVTAQTARYASDAGAPMGLARRPVRRIAAP